MPEWLAKYVDYKALKKLLKKITEARARARNNLLQTNVAALKPNKHGSKYGLIWIFQ